MSSQKQRPLVQLPPKKKRIRWLELIAFTVTVCVLLSAIYLFIRPRFSSNSPGANDNSTVTTDKVVDTNLTPRITPVSTPISQTKPGTVLKEGQTWYGDGLSLTLEQFCVVKCGEHIQAKFRLENLTDEGLVVDILGEDFTIVLEDKYILSEGVVNQTGSLRHNEIRSQFVETDTDIEWEWLFTYRKPNTLKPELLPLNSERFVLNVDKIGHRIQKATWEGYIPR